MAKNQLTGKQALHIFKSQKLKRFNLFNIIK